MQHDGPGSGWFGSTEVRIERELSEALGRKVDLLTERALSPYLRGQILEESRVIFERAA